MKPLLALLLTSTFFFSLPVPARAAAAITSVTVAAQTINDWRFGGATAKLRVYASETFEQSGSFVIGSAPGSGSWYKQIDCTVAGTVLSIPQFSLLVTTTSSHQNASYTFVFVDANGTERGVYLSGIKVPDTYGANVTFAQLFTYSTSKAARPRPYEIYSKDQVNALLASVNGAPVATNTIQGKARLSVPAASSSDPIVAGDNDPRLGMLYRCGGADDTAGLLGAINALSADGVLTVSGTCVLTSEILLQGKRNLKIRGLNRVANFGGGSPATLRWNGAGTGPMIKLDSCQGMTIEGLNFDITTGKSLNGFIDIDGAGHAGTISTANNLNDNSFNGSNQAANSNFKAISISATATTNNEHMKVLNNYILCPGQVPRVADTGSISSGSPNLTVTGLNLTSADIGKKIRVGLAGSSSTTLETTITAVPDSTHATLAANSSATVNNVRVHVGSGVGVGIYNGPSANALHQEFIDNNISYCAKAVQFRNGSGVVSNLQGGTNDVNVYLETLAGEGVQVALDRTENSLQGVVMTATPNSVTVLEGLRGAQPTQLTEGWLVLDGQVILLGNTWGWPPPTGGALIKSRGSGNLRLTSASNYTTSTGPVSLSQIGYTAIASGGEIVGSLNESGITDEPSAVGYFSGSGRRVGVAAHTSAANGQAGDFFGLQSSVSNTLGVPSILVGASGEIGENTVNAAGTVTIGVRSFMSTLGNHGGSADYYGFRFYAPSAVGNARDAFGLYLAAHPAAGITRDRFGIYQAGANDVNRFFGPIYAQKEIRTNSAANTDLAGVLTLSAGTASYTFTQTYSSAPICTVSDTTAANPVRVQTTTTTLTITGTGTDVINYICVGRN